jgi:hypothetical protein
MLGAVMAGSSVKKDISYNVYIYRVFLRCAYIGVEKLEDSWVMPCNVGWCVSNLDCDNMAVVVLLSACAQYLVRKSLVLSCHLKQDPDCAH